ncbi:inositol monophosphatase family protein [Pseudoruegeria sp. HB172150]|uniref:inositol monophosphatase family protein n=1 Tax=Pseudoruegeria sp. HB172150 TaxID=2721164 RepID=UPI001557C214|nr:inositol monophosphatase family protein [Pseudoruegeria sp. HB172150]
MDPISDSLKAELLDTANALADAARSAILPHFRAVGLAAENKAGIGFDPVTAADRAAEAIMRDILAERRPEDGILGEEYGAKTGTTGLTWVLDPIDGTRGFISGTPTWGVLIAVGPEDGPILGVIDQPYIGERFVGGLGIAELDGPMGNAPLRTRAPRALSQATILTTFPEVGTDQEGAAFHRLSANANLTRYGMDCYGYALLAAGQVDLVVEAGLFAYDIQAPLAVIEAAGGVVTDWEGHPCPMGGRVLAAANTRIHAEALEILRGTAPND